jgi:transposase
MQGMYGRLSEKDRRWYVGVEALKLSYGGISYIAELFGCSRNTVMRGITELGAQETLPRKRGGGRKPTVGTQNKADIDEAFRSILKDCTAGDPMAEKVKWTNLTKADIADLLTKKGFTISRNIVQKLLKKHGYVRRKALKRKRRRVGMLIVMPNLNASPN